MTKSRLHDKASLLAHFKARYPDAIEKPATTLMWKEPRRTGRDYSAVSGSQLVLDREHSIFCGLGDSAPGIENAGKRGFVLCEGVVKEFYEFGAPAADDRLELFMDAIDKARKGK